jgi:hypothetical protein
LALSLEKDKKSFFHGVHKIENKTSMEQNSVYFMDVLFSNVLVY